VYDVQKLKALLLNKACPDFLADGKQNQVFEACAVTDTVLPLSICTQHTGSSLGPATSPHWRIP
jgi:hypothetical protein